MPPPGPIETRIKALAEEIFDPNDLAAFVLTPKLIARSASFVVLAHAEIEYALEQACRTTADLLKTSGEPALAMIVWGYIALKDGIVSMPKKTPIEKLVEIYSKEIDKNHGIKKHNLTNLLTPIGVDLDANLTDVEALHEFGERRGLLAHNPINHWNSTDLPSTHSVTGIQAGRSADQIITSIIASHTSIHPQTSPQFSTARRFKRKVGKSLRSLAHKIDGRS